MRVKQPRRESLAISRSLSLNRFVATAVDQPIAWRLTRNAVQARHYWTCQRITVIILTNPTTPPIGIVFAPSLL